MLIHEEDPIPAPERDRGSARPGDPSQAAGPTILNQMGGVAGFAYSTVPVIVFVTANALLPLPVAVGVAGATGLALFVFRLLRGERLVSAIGSLLGVAVAAGIVAWTGSARDFFVIGIWASLAGFVVTLASVLARRPLTGVIWNALAPAGATAFGEDLPHTEVHLLDGGHFLLESSLDEVADLIRDFLGRTLPA
ncbi:DUF3159 domain-containing protein [Micromonospora sp. NPDC005413]|uniref:DUF3159 domain-containing protein n=1 Tax=Micromonospora sp. NPDC005413 TaxID=3154563 RepID=UPI0033A61FB4